MVYYGYNPENDFYIHKNIVKSNEIEHLDTLPSFKGNEFNSYFSFAEKKIIDVVLKYWIPNKQIYYICNYSIPIQQMKETNQSLNYNTVKEYMNLYYRCMNQSRREKTKEEILEANWLSRFFYRLAKKIAVWYHKE